MTIETVETKAAVIAAAEKAVKAKEAKAKKAAKAEAAIEKELNILFTEKQNKIIDEMSNFIGDAANAAVFEARKDKNFNNDGAMYAALKAKEFMVTTALVLIEIGATKELQKIKDYAHIIILKAMKKTMKLLKNNATTEDSMKIIDDEILKTTREALKIQ